MIRRSIVYAFALVLAGCASGPDSPGLLQYAIFYANSATVKWVGEIDGVAIKRSDRFETSNYKARVSMLASADSLDYFVEVTFDTSAPIGANAECVVTSGSTGAFTNYFGSGSGQQPKGQTLAVRFNADFSDGREHQFKISDAQAGIRPVVLKLQMLK